MAPLVTIDRLSIRFPNQSNAAVDEVSFQILPGETFALAGESGSGKSLTAMSLPSLLPASAHISGAITGYFPDAINLLHPPENSFIRGREIGMIFQEPMTALNPVYTCGDQVMESLQLHKGLSRKTAAQQTIELFEQVGLPQPAAMLHRYPHQLSGGQRQRVMIAIAIAPGPRLLIADEPTTALDVQVQREIMELLNSIRREAGMSMLLISHDLNLVAKYAQRVGVMEKGKIVETGTTQKVLEDPEHPYTRKLINSRVKKHSKLYPLPDQTNNRTEPWNFPPIGEELVKVSKLTVRYRGSNKLSATAVEDVSFSIFENEIVGLVGESGSGKSTLGKALLQLVEPDEGNIYFAGESLSALSEKKLRRKRRDFQVVFQDPYGSLNPSITVGDAILEVIRWHQPDLSVARANERVAELLEMVHLSSDMRNRYPHQFSGGQRQRISIARALATRPRFLVFDESVSALDITVQAQILNLIQELREKTGFTALFISHDLAVVHYLCNRIMVMKAGRIIESGDAEQIMHAPGEDYTKELVNTVM